MLKENFQPVDLEFQFAKASDAETVDEIQTFLEDSVKDGCEGLTSYWLMVWCCPAVQVLGG